MIDRPIQPLHPERGEGIVRWGVLLGVTVIMALIVLYEWPKMKHTPKKDKAAFFFLLMVGWVLAMFDLPNIAGPVTWLDALFKPIFGKILEN